MKPAILILAALSIVRGATGQPERKPLGEIEFFGYKDLNVEEVRAALPLREGELFPEETGSSGDFKHVIGESVRQVIGRPLTDVAIVCCDDRQNWMIFIGLPGASSRRVSYNPAPHEDLRLPASVVKLWRELEEAMITAVMKGKAGEDDSQGFALAFDPALRAKETALRDYALHDERTILHVLEASSRPQQRAIAASALGYARNSSRQVAALARACLDADANVRNNAARALGVLAGAKPEVARRIPAGNFVQLLASEVWTDHNKGAMLLDSMTRRSRDAGLLKQLRDDALDNLIEMARWRNPGHAESALKLLGRIAGIEESRLQQLVDKRQTEEIITAASGLR